MPNIHHTVLLLLLFMIMIALLIFFTLKILLVFLQPLRTLQIFPYASLPVTPAHHPSSCTDASMNQTQVGAIRMWSILRLRPYG